MKKSLILCAFLLCTSVLSVNAQKEWRPGFLRHWSLGVGAGTTGAELELATTLGHHFQLRAGVTSLPYVHAATLDMDYSEMFAEVDSRVLNHLGIDPAAIPNELYVNAGLGLSHGKVLMDIYPFKGAAIRLTAGAYFAQSEKLVSVDAEMPQELVDAYDKVRGEVPNASSGIDFVDAAPDGVFDAFVAVEKVKPYVGIGFGRAVPKRRLGLNLDLGVMFHDVPKVGSSNPAIADVLNNALVEYEVADIVNQVVIYPVISLRLVGRIF